ncbi:MAG: hypothetical protein B7X06_04240, partial [Verrucomicrobia bacterium 21-51-4]
IDQILESVKKISPAPQILPKMQKLLGDEYASLEDVTELIKLDSGLTAQIVRLSNSAYFGSVTPCHNIDEAANRLGFKEIYRAVSLAASRETLGSGAPLYGLNAKQIWCEALSVAMFLSHIARTLAFNVDTAYTIGLLHSTGKVAMSEFCSSQKIPIKGVNLSNATQEKKLLGYTHAQVAGCLLMQWKFPDNIRIPIEYQLNPLDAPDYQSMAAAMYMGIRLAPAIYGTSAPIDTLLSDPEAINIRELSDLTAEELQNAVGEARADFAHVSTQFITNNN